MLYCKRCTGSLYEEEIFYDEDGIKYMQIGCLMCSDKLYIDFKEWMNFVNMLEDNIKRLRDEKSKVNS